MAEAPPAGRKLESWKEIAAYLGREVRTVQRWEKSEGLPVRRLGHLKRGSVYAYTAELDGWLAARAPDPPTAAAPADPIIASPAPCPIPHAQPRSRRLAGWALAGVLALAAAFWFTSPRPPVVPPPTLNLQRLFASATTEGGHLHLLDAGSDPGALVVTRGGRELYVANESAHSIVILDTASLATLATLHLAIAPGALAATPDGARVIAASAASSGLDLIETRSRQITWIPLSAAVSDMASAPDSRSLYLAQGFGGLSRLDLDSFQLTHLATSACPSALALAPGGGTLYVGYQCGGPAGRAGHDAIGVFDTRTQRFTATLAGTVPMVATALAVTPDGNELWSSSGDACTANYDHVGCLATMPTPVYVFSTTSGKLLARIAASAGPVERIRFLAGGALALLNGRLADTTRREVLEALPEQVVADAVLDDGQRVFLSLANRHSVAVFDAHAAHSGSCSPPDDNLAAWWPADGSAADAWGISAGHPSPGLRYAPGRIGQGFLFDGRSSVNFGHDADLAQSLKDGLTLAFWIKPLASRPGLILSQQSPDGTRGWRLVLDPQLRLQFCLAGRCRSARYPLQPGAWHFVAVIAHGSRSTVYLDGQPALQASPTPDAIATAADLIAGQGFTGVLDEITVYSSTLTPAALQTLRNLPACLR